ncbi:DUF2750 domain-containing protein [Paraferrimonas sp. SM1919]|uniref:DUF2750 domain-containing protein n=1 Tax=Paraferrimonas sp. SM1919 TaxID=2662263 RepID=UPI0013D1A1FE|nr:DUF2750 domain-containing protein [Paraferrimonas sp. SM1919]
MIAPQASSDPELRLKHLLNAVKASNKIWILTDADGCMMLNTEDEDCVPIWPSEETAKTFAIDEWQHCQPQQISVAKWKSRWSYGLADDELAIVIHPDSEGNGVILDPLEFDQLLPK